METGQVILISALILGPAAILWLIYLSRQTPRRKPAALLGIPHALRPGQSDDVLEGPRLQAIQVGGLIAVAASALFIPLYWLPEAERQESFAERFEEQSIERGELIFAAPPPLEEDISAIKFKEEEKALALGQACANCHGGGGAGGIATPAFRDPTTGFPVAYTAPPLDTVFSRWDEEIVRFTIERGRPGTPMPTWGVEFGGSMTPLMIDDVMAYLRSIQKPLPELSEDCRDPSKNDREECGQEIFEVRCEVCHGPKASGKEGGGRPESAGGTQWYPGMALWKGDVRHLSPGQHFLTVTNGRRFAFMPPFGEAPAQGIPVPPNPLTDSQIKAVVRYERSL